MKRFERFSIVAVRPQCSLCLSRCVRTKPARVRLGRLMCGGGFAPPLSPSDGSGSALDSGFALFKFRLKEFLRGRNFSHIEFCGAKAKLTGIAQNLLPACGGAKPPPHIRRPSRNVASQVYAKAVLPSRNFSETHLRFLRSKNYVNFLRH